MKPTTENAFEACIEETLHDKNRWHKLVKEIAIKGKLIFSDKLHSMVFITIEKLREYRTALISAAITGKIRVGDENN